MQENDRKDFPDPFREAIRSKLEGYSLAPGENGYERIALRLNGKRRRIALWVNTVGAAAAVAALLLLSILPEKKLQQPMQTYELIEAPETLEQTGLPNTPADEPTAVSPPAVESKRPVKSTTAQSDKIENRHLTPVTVTTSSETASVAETTQPGKATNQPEEQKEPKADPRVIKDQPYLLASRDNSAFDNPRAVKSKRKRQSISLLVGTSGALALNNGEERMYADVIQDGSKEILSPINSEPGYSQAAEELINNADFKEEHYHLPLSFGLTTRISTSRKSAIETGLVYTFLSADFRTVYDEFSKSEATFKLHYLGIPLNFQTTLWENNKKGRFYFSFGGMVEKGLRSVYKQEDTYYSTIREVEVKEQIKGLQWSLASSLGFDYPIIKHYYLYLEPRVSYHFDNGQPVSSRTEHPFDFGISAGIRYDW